MIARISFLAIGFAMLASGCDPGSPSPAPPSLEMGVPPADMAMSSPQPDLSNMPPPTLADGQYRTTSVAILGSCFTDLTEGDFIGTYEVSGEGYDRALSIKKVGTADRLCIASLAPDGRFKNGIFLQDENCAWRVETVCAATPDADNQFTLVMTRTLSDVQSRPGKTCNKTPSMCNTHYTIRLVHP